jgi:hypothetical protein
MTERTLPKNSALTLQKLLSFLWLIADSGWNLINRTMFDSLIKEIVRLNRNSGGDIFGENVNDCFRQ